MIYFNFFLISEASEDTSFDFTIVSILFVLFTGSVFAGVEFFAISESCGVKESILRMVIVKPAYSSGAR